MAKTRLPYLFRYSGGKRNLIPLMRKPNAYKRIVEPYLGSGCYILQGTGTGLGIEINQNIVGLWIWLKNYATPERLRELQNIVKEVTDKGSDNKTDVRDLGLSPDETTYVKINTAGVYSGQLSSWKIYPQHSLPVEQTISFLPRLKEIDIIHGDAEEYIEQDGDLVFIDPPYIQTKANYKQDGKAGIEQRYSIESTLNLVKRIKSPIIFTYGTNAADVFPEINWEILTKKKVPNIRRGGSIDRVEHIAYLNWR